MCTYSCYVTGISLTLAQLSCLNKSFSKKVFAATLKCISKSNNPLKKKCDFLLQFFFFQFFSLLNCLETGSLRLGYLCFFKEELCYIMSMQNCGRYKSTLTTFLFQTQKKVKYFTVKYHQHFKFHKKSLAIVPKNDNYIIPTM